MEDLIEKLVEIAQSEDRESLKEKLGARGIYLDLYVMACVPTVAAPPLIDWHPPPVYSVRLRGYQFHSALFVMKALRNFALKPYAQYEPKYQEYSLNYSSDLKSVRDIVYKSEKEPVEVFKTEVKEDAQYLAKILKESGADVIVEEKVESL